MKRQLPKLKEENLKGLRLWSAESQTDERMGTDEGLMEGEV
jgi:hypothetical protein